MNRNLIFDFLSLRLSQKRAIRQEMGFGDRHAHESDKEYDQRFLTFISHEGNIRTFEALVIEETKRK